MKPQSRSLRLFVIGLLAIGIVCGYLLWKNLNSSFPTLAPGSYGGTIDFKRPGFGSAPLKVYLERNQDGVSLSVLHSEWTTQFYTNEELVVLQHQPLLIMSPKGKLYLSGKISSSGTFSGSIKNSENEDLGSWQFTALVELPNMLSSSELEGVRDSVILAAQLQEIRERSKAAELTVNQQKQEIEKLTQFITEGESLKSNSDKRFETSNAELDKYKQILQAKRNEAKALSDKLELSQRLTEMGKLVSLARESLERENRWIDSVLKTSLAENSADLEAAVLKAERIASMKEEILRLGGKLGTKGLTAEVKQEYE